MYAIDEWHSPNYLFLRDCPRIGVWPVETTSNDDQAAFQAFSTGRMKFWIDAKFESAWHNGSIYRYEFDSKADFTDCHDHGVWVSRDTLRPVAEELITDLPEAAQVAGVEVEVVPSLVDVARRFFDFEAKVFTTTLHVSMIRMSLLPDWELAKGKPVAPK